MSTEARIKQHIDHLFTGAPSDSRVNDIKNEITLNTTDRYHDLLSQGKSEQDAYTAAIGSIGDISELLTSLGAKPGTGKTAAAPQPAKKIKGNGRLSRLKGQMGNIIWMLMLTAYFLLSFITMAWHITWLIFLITPALVNVAFAIVDLFRGEREDPPCAFTSAQRKAKENISLALWLLVTVLYFIISFAAGNIWHLSWIIFLLGSALQSGMELIFLPFAVVITTETDDFKE